MSLLPPELIEFIMMHLDCKTFLICRQVCKLWCQIIDRFSKNDTIWKRFCEEDIPDASDTIYHKGKLSWHDIYFRTHIWHKMNSHIPEQTSIKCSNNPITILDLSVSRDGTVSVCLEDHARYYSAEDLQPIHEITNGRFTKVFTNDFAEFLRMENEKLCIKVKYPISANQLICIDNVHLARACDEICYYVTFRQEVYVHNYLESIVAPTKVKWYNSDKITRITCFKKHVYLLTHSNKILKYTNNRLELVNHFRLPHYSTTFTNEEIHYLFRGPNLMYSNFKYLSIYLASGKKVQYKLSIKISCLLLHGNTFIIGTVCGQVLLFSINSSDDLLSVDIDNPLSRIHLKCFGSPRIEGIDAYEGFDHCSIFCWTHDEIFVLKYAIEN